MLKIISGGQSGIDQMGLKVAANLGIPTGGTAPHGWRTENGPRPVLKNFGLVESWSPDYNIRTEQNVKDSDGTLIFGDITSVGTRKTISYLKNNRKPYVCNPSVKEGLFFLRQNRILTINIAGNRGSKLTEYQRHEIGTILYEILKLYKEEIDALRNTH